MRRRRADHSVSVGFTLLMVGGAGILDALGTWGGWLLLCLLGVHFLCLGIYMNYQNRAETDDE